MGLQTGSIFSNTNYGIPENEELLSEILSKNGFNLFLWSMGTWSVINTYLPTMALNILMAFLLLTPHKNIQNRVWYENDTIIKNSYKG